MSRPASKKADYYGSFSDALRQTDQSNTQQSAANVRITTEIVADPEPIAAVEAEDGPFDPVALLKVLQASGTQEMTKLQASTNLKFSKFAGVVAKLEEAGLVKISGSPGSEQAEITPAGEILAGLG